MASNPDNGMVTIPSRHSVDETVEKLQNMLHAKGVKLFALIDHSGEAKQASMQMRPTKLLIWRRLDFLQQPRLPAGAAPVSAGTGSQHRRRRRTGRTCRRVSRLGPLARGR